MNRLFEAEAFVLVVEEGSFTAAARRLGITKSYASKLVTRLEDRLLPRSTRKRLAAAAVPTGRLLSRGRWSTIQ